MSEPIFQIFRSVGSGKNRCGIQGPVERSIEDLHIIEASPIRQRVWLFYGTASVVGTAAFLILVSNRGASLTENGIPIKIDAYRAESVKGLSAKCTRLNPQTGSDTEPFSRNFTSQMSLELATFWKRSKQ